MHIILIYNLINNFHQAYRSIFLLLEPLLIGPINIPNTWSRKARVDL